VRFLEVFRSLNLLHQVVLNITTLPDVPDVPDVPCRDRLLVDVNISDQGGAYSASTYKFLIMTVKSYCDTY
jgi:hypothetical protein